MKNERLHGLPAETENKMKPVEKIMSWPDLFGETGADIPEKVRKERWEEWKKIAIAAGDQDVVDYWARDNIDEGCAGCIHRNGDWCNNAGLPCNINPILTFRCGLIGMACMGLGYTPTYKQLTIFDK